MIEENRIGTEIVDAAYRVHVAMGPGLLESVYEAAMTIDLEARGLRVERQKPIEARYHDTPLGLGFRLDLLVNGLVIVELKAVESIKPVFKKTLLTYLKLTDLRLGYLINFNEVRVRDGITRIANGLNDSSPPSASSAPPRETT